MPESTSSPSQVVEQFKKDENERQTYKYTEEERIQQKIWFQRIDDSWSAMNAPLDEFDSESLIQTCRNNRLARNSFLTPVQNDGEVRVVTGTTEGKVDSVFNAVFNQNLEEEIEAYNEHSIEESILGDKLTKIVRRTGQMENEEDIEASATDELLTMPAVFIQETNTDEWYYDRVLSEGEWADVWQFKMPKFKNVGWYRKREPRKVLWTADQVLLADIRIPSRLFQTQPYIIRYRIRTVEDARRVYRHSPRAKFINGGAPQKQELRGNVESSDWTFTRKLKNNEVEEITCESVCDDEKQIYLAGVPMLPVGCPMLGNRFQKYDMTMEVMKEIHRKFAYGRPLVSMVKVLQALKDEDFRLAVLQRRQQIWQPIVTKAQAILSKDMWLPAAITYGISKDEVQSLMEKQSGVDNSMQEMIKNEIEQFINVSSLFQGADTPNMTAYQAAQQMKQALIMLGHALVARMRMKRNCTYLRLYNILQNMLDPIDTRFNDYLGTSEDVYRTYSLRDTDLYDGRVGTEIISFIDRALTPEENATVLKLEADSRAEGRPRGYTFLPAQNLKMAPRMFHVNIYASEKRNSLIEKEVFKQDIKDSLELGAAVGVGVNPDFVTQEWGKRVKIDASKLFVVPQAPALGGPQGVIPQPPASSTGGKTGSPVATPVGQRTMLEANAMAMKQ